MSRLISVTFLLSLLCCATLPVSCNKEQQSDDGVLVFSANGDINPVLNQFRQQLGVLNTLPGAVGGRREINWDGVPATLVNTALPGNLFNPSGAGASPGFQRGLTYAGTSGSFSVSDNFFANVNSGAAGEFKAFSGNQVFANTGANLWDIGFQVPGETAAAAVKGFGIVFSDVDREQSVYLEFFSGDQTLGRFYAPVHDATSSFSFLGVYFNNATVTRIQVAHQGPLSSGGKDISNGGGADLIILDDVIYSEPVRQ